MVKDNSKRSTDREAKPHLDVLIIHSVVYLGRIVGCLAHGRKDGIKPTTVYAPHLTYSHQVILTHEPRVGLHQT